MKILWALFSSMFCSLLGYGQWSTLTLPAGRYSIMAENIGDTIFFSSGTMNSGFLYSKIDRYDANTNTWLPQLTIPQSRSFAGSTVLGHKAYFGGGTQNQSSVLNSVDIYDNATATWSSASLSKARMFLACTHAGNKVLFAGGIQDWSSLTTLNVVDIYDASANTWSAHTLSVPRALIGSATDGNVAIFAGGAIGNGNVTDAVDIYNAITNIWTTAKLSEARAECNVAYYNGKFYIAGGHLAGAYNVTGTVDIYDIASNTWSKIAPLPTPRGDARAVVLADKLFFAGGENVNLNTFILGQTFDDVDIYNAITNTWSSAKLSNNSGNPGVVASANKVFIGGGYSSSTFSIHNIIDIYTETPSGIENVSITETKINIFPNPSSKFLNINYDNNSNIRLDNFSIINSEGREIASNYLTKLIDISHLQNGHYFICFKKGNSIRLSKKFSIIH